MKTISFVIPSRNNLKYLKWSYNSIRKNLGYTHEIMLADDFSSDDTWEWLQEIKEKDINVQIFHILIGFISLLSLISYFRWWLNNNFIKQNV